MRANRRGQHPVGRRDQSDGVEKKIVIQGTTGIIKVDGWLGLAGIESQRANRIPGIRGKLLESCRHGRQPAAPCLSDCHHGISYPDPTAPQGYLQIIGSPSSCQGRLDRELRRPIRVPSEITVSNQPLHPAFSVPNNTICHEGVRPVKKLRSRRWTPIRQTTFHDDHRPLRPQRQGRRLARHAPRRVADHQIVTGRIPRPQSQNRHTAARRPKHPHPIVRQHHSVLPPLIVQRPRPTRCTVKLHPHPRPTAHAHRLGGDRRRIDNVQRGRSADDRPHRVAHHYVVTARTPLHRRGNRVRRVGRSGNIASVQSPLITQGRRPRHTHRKTRPLPKVHRQRRRMRANRRGQPRSGERGVIVRVKASVGLLFIAIAIAVAIPFARVRPEASLQQPERRRIRVHHGGL